MNRPSRRSFIQFFSAASAKDKLPRGGLFRLIFALALLVAMFQPMLPSPVSAAPSNNVLILGSTVTNGTNSLEAQAIRAQGLNPIVVDGPTWQGMTTAQFASYRAIVLGDPTCDPESTPTPYAAATASVAQWGPAVQGNVIVIGTDPVYHATVGGRPDAGNLITGAMDFVLADPTRTGAYLDLSCSYDSTPSQLAPVLSYFGNFTVHGVGCNDNIDIVAQQAALTDVTNSDLSGWECSVHEAFSSWPGPQSPGGGTGDFLVLAIDINNGSSFHASDGSVGDPYILARGAGLVPITGSSPTYKCQGARFQFPTNGPIGWLYQDPRSQWDGPPNQNSGHIDRNDLKDPTIHVGVDFLPSTDNRVWPLASGVIERMNASGTSGNIWYNDAGASQGVTTYITELNFDPAIVKLYQSQGYVNVDPNTPIGTIGASGHVHMSFSSKVGAYDASYDDFNLAESQDPSSFFAANLFEPLGKNFQAYVEYNASKDAQTGLVPILPVTEAQLSAYPGRIDVVNYVPQPSSTTAWNKYSSTGVWPLGFDSSKLRNPYPFSKMGKDFCNIQSGGTTSSPTPSRIIDRTTPMTSGTKTSGTFWLGGALLGLQQILNIVVGPVYSDVDLVLTRPDGTIVSSADPGVQYSKTGNFVTYTIQNAQTGEWSYTIAANTLDPGGENVRITVDESNGGSGFTDLTGPATNTVISPAPKNGVNNGPVTITLNAVDNPGGSGVQSITYGTSGAENLPMTTVTGSSTSFTVSNTGTTTVYYFATDAVGNQEILRSFNVQIQPSDTTPPSTTASVSPIPNADGWNNKDVTVTLSATDTDGPTDVKQITYSATGAQPISTATTTGSTVAIPITAEGVTTLTFFATDNANNAETPKTLTVKLDKTSPVIAIGGVQSGGTYTNSAIPTIGIADPNGADGTPGSGVDPSKTVITLDGQPYTGGTPITVMGQHTLVVSAADLAGNPANQTVSFTVVHTTSLTITSSNTLPVRGATVSAKLTDTAPSGAVMPVGLPVTFTAGGKAVVGTTDSTGVVTATLALDVGKYSITANLDGNDSNGNPTFYLPSSAPAQTLYVYQPTQFVIWGGNPPIPSGQTANVTIGQDYTFWGAQWAKQVQGGNFQANNSFKGYASQVDWTNATWSSDPGNSSTPPSSVATYIGTIVATSAAKNGSVESGNVTEMVVLQVDNPDSYQPDPGHSGSGMLVAVVH